MEFETGGTPSAIGVVDLRCDGDLDLVVTNYVDSALTIFDNRTIP
jgi:hypothetical protein